MTLDAGKNGATCSSNKCAEYSGPDCMHCWHGKVPVVVPVHADWGAVQTQQGDAFAAMQAYVAPFVPGPFSLKSQPIPTLLQR